MESAVRVGSPFEAVTAAVKTSSNVRFKHLDLLPGAPESQVRAVQFGNVRWDQHVATVLCGLRQLGQCRASFGSFELSLSAADAVNGCGGSSGY